MVVSVAVIVRDSDIDPATTPGPATEASHFPVSPRRLTRAERIFVAESDQRRKSVAISVMTTDVRESAAPRVKEPWPLVRASSARSP